MASGLVRTLRIRTRRKLGNLGLLATALGDAGATIGEISTLKFGHSFTLRDFNLVLDDENHLGVVLDAVRALADSEIVEVVNQVKAVHEGGKLRTRARAPMDSVTALQTALTPGVSEIVGLIDKEPLMVDRYTGVQRTVAIVSDGSGLRGVGRVRSQAMLPVLEAKSALLASRAGLNALPLVLDVQTEDEFVAAVKAIRLSCGAVLMDAMAGARAVRVGKRLNEELDVPVIHDDADAPAIAGLAAVINACRRTGKDMGQVSIGQLGLGTAGAAIAELIMRFTKRPVLGEDVHPASVSRHVALGGRGASLEDIMSSCDVVVANTGHGDVIPPSFVREGQAILALSEPRPEIEPYDATLAGAAFAADGRAMNKAVVLPGLLLGALAVKAREINDEMKIAAALTLADAAEEGDLLPTPLEHPIHATVAAAVARAAVATGVGRGVDASLLVPEIFFELIADERALPL